MYCLSALNKIMDLGTAITQSKTMRIKNPSFLLHKEFDSLCSRKAGFFVSIDFGVVHAVQRSVPTQKKTWHAHPPKTATGCLV